MTRQASLLQESSWPAERLPASIEVLPPADVLATLEASPRVEAVILDPWYNKGTGGVRGDYDDWLAGVVREACKIANHVFVWGFPEILAHQIARIPEGVPPRRLAYLVLQELPVGHSGLALGAEYLPPSGCFRCADLP